MHTSTLPIASDTFKELVEKTLSNGPVRLCLDRYAVEFPTRETARTVENGYSTEFFSKLLDDMCCSLRSQATKFRMPVSKGTRGS